jgi:hypothetical protein
MLKPKPQALVATVVAALGLAATQACSQTRGRSSAEQVDPKPSVRVDLIPLGLPSGFFDPDADTRCGHQIIGYRFVLWLNNDALVVGFNTSPNCRPSPQAKVSGLARLLLFNRSGVLKVQRDIPYLADGNGELVAPGEAMPGPKGTLVFRIESVNLDPEGRNESKSGVIQLDENLREIAHLDGFLEAMTFVDHALVFGSSGAYTVFNGAPLIETGRRQRNWPVDARDRKFGEHGVAYMTCQQEVRPNEYVSTGIVHAWAKQRCAMNAESDDQERWSVPLRDGETASILGILPDGSVLGNLNVSGSKAGRLVVWKKGQTAEALSWIADSYCGAFNSATSDMSRYAALASDDCNDIGGLFRILGVGRSTSAPGRWMVFDRRSKALLVDHQLPKNARASLSPDGLHYASFEGGELRLYMLPSRMQSAQR